jgi:multiple antibiotic resistance protein
MVGKYPPARRLRPAGKRSGCNADMDVLKPLLTLLAVLNPIGVIPFFIHFTSRLSPAQRYRTTWIVTGTVFLVIAASALGGLQLLRFFGISIASFQVGGGVLLLINAVQMLNAEPADSSTRELDAANRKLDAGDSVAVSPLAVPLITGPATISTMIIYAEKSQGLADQALLVGYAAVGALATFACLAASERITRLLGQTGINVMTRLMGLVLAAIGVEIMADGLGKLFPALLR